ncbi:Ger(x)C family spore germination protein [Sporosarcina luteola]|uniref:Ger(x)C family spore germination protein n=1 Tax=Sporosarcina luteola TaxID=582850 RepID=UPI002040AFCB|nr:Ger(x)C family spore germination protein [Sporosarcina luteola]MCM3637570.1 Ger(x)C family spore germination protein [Sporosarcina luteola]
MKKIVLVSIACSLLLAGCWDERLYKDITIVPLIGYDGEPGKWSGYFTYGVVANPDSFSFSTVEGSGVSIEEARLDANRKTSETLDPSQVLVVLLSTKAVKTDLLETFDIAYRMPRTRLSSRFVVVEGDLAPFMEKTEKMGKEVPDYYDETLNTAIFASIIPDEDIQLAARLLLDEGIDLQLPYVKMSETTGTPEVAGVVLFSDKVFSGHTLDTKESTIIQILKKKPGDETMFTYEWEKEGKKYPVTVGLVKYNKKWNIKDSKINAAYKMKVQVNEFANNHLDEEKKRKELEGFLSKELTNDFNEVIKKLQEAKSDPVGFGRTVRAFHPHLWKKGKWQDTFSELDINVKVEVEITRTGILN